MLTNDTTAVAKTRLETRQAMAVRNKERRRIARELHDGVCQELIAIGLAAKRLEHALTKKARREAARASEISEVVCRIATELRDIAYDLTPAPLRNRSLVSSINELGRTVQKETGIRCTFEYDPAAVVTDTFAAHHLYRIVQECVNNAARHGSATFIAISLREANGGITLSVENDGSDLPAAQKHPDTLGIRSMRYRARAIHGSLSIRRRGCGGVSVVCCLKQKAQ